MVTYKNGSIYTHVPSNKDKVSFDFLEQHGGDPIAFLKSIGVTETEIVESAAQEALEAPAPIDQSAFLAGIEDEQEAPEAIA